MMIERVDLSSFHDVAITRLVGRVVGSGKDGWVAVCKHRIGRRPLLEPDDDNAFKDNQEQTVAANRTDIESRQCPPSIDKLISNRIVEYDDTRCRSVSPNAF